MMFKRVLLVAALLGAPAAAWAQAHGAIRGVVFDSLAAGRPLENAEVWIEGSGRTARTDARGRFAFDSLPAGEYRLTFFHQALEGLGVTAPVKTVAVATGAPVEVRFDTPSPRTVYAAMCGVVPDSGIGVLVGRLRREGSGAPVARAEVGASWTIWTLAKGGMRQSPREVSTRSDETGTFILCGVPGDVPVAIRAQGDDGSAASQEISMGESTVALRSFDLPAPGAPAAGGTRLEGTVRTAAGKPVAGAQVHVLGTEEVATTDASGRYSFSGLRGGPAMLETKALGFRPVRSAVTLAENRTTRLTTTFDERVVVLSTLRVLGRPAPLSTTGFEARMRSGLGTYLTRSDIERRNAYSVNDLFATIPGVEVRMQGFGGEVVFSRSLGQFGVMADRCNPVWYVDGVRWRALELPNERAESNVPPEARDDPSARSVRPVGLDAIMRPSDIEGIEVYKNVASAPPQFQPMDSGCGVILVWTRRRPGR